MFGTSGAGSHRILFSNPPLRRVFIVSSLGRFGYAVLPLCLLFSIAQGSGSFRTAALASAAFGLGGLVMPVEARLLDQHGQRRVLPLLGGWFTAFLITVWGATHLFQISPEWWILLCALGGAGAPSLGPSMRAQWREATDEPLRSVAYSVDAIVEEILFLVGPLTASAFLAVGHPEHGLLLAAALIALGVIGLCRSPYRPAIRGTRPPASRRHRWIGPLNRPGFVRLAFIMLVAGFALSASLTALAAQAELAQVRAVTGLAETAAGLASVVGALVWTRFAPRWPWRRQVTVLLLPRLPLVVACALFPQLWVIAAAFVLTGFLTAPTFVVGYAAGDQESDPDRHTEASTWVTTASNLGMSAGTAVAGWFHGMQLDGAVFAVAAGLILAALLLALRCGRGIPGPCG